MKTSDTIPEPLPAPVADDVLFGFDARDPMANAGLNTSWRPDIFYSLGYREGAVRLVNHVLETHSDQDTLIFPIVFLYRHHVELLLKRLVVVACFVVSRNLTKAEVSHLGKHRIDWLWDDLKPTLSASYRKANLAPLAKKSMAGVASYISQLSDVDPKSESFRYSITMDGNLALPGLTRINIRTFAEKMERLCDFLASIEFDLESHLNFEAEMRADAM